MPTDIKNASGQTITVKTVDDLLGVVGAINDAAQPNPAASATVVSILKAVRDNTGNGVVLTANMVRGLTAPMSGTAVTQALAAGGANVRNMVSEVILANDSAVDTLVNVLDGVTTMTVFFVPAKSTVGAVFPVPLVGSANTPVNLRNATTGSSVTGTIVGWRE